MPVRIEVFGEDLVRSKRANGSQVVSVVRRYIFGAKAEEQLDAVLMVSCQSAERRSNEAVRMKQYRISVWETRKNLLLSNSSQRGRSGGRQMNGCESNDRIEQKRS